MNSNTDTLLLAFNNATELSNQDFEYLFSLATDKRKERAKKFLHREDSCRSLVAEALLRYGLKKYGIDSDLANISTNSYGRPEISDSAIKYNLSHSGNWVVASFDYNEIGVDVERIHNVDKALSERFFAPREHAYLQLIKNDSLWLDSFFTIWVLKESYIKSIGKGLSCTLNTFSVIPDGQGEVVLDRFDTGLPMRYFKLYFLDHNHHCALCKVENSAFPSRTDITIDDLKSCLG